MRFAVIDADGALSQDESCGKKYINFGDAIQFLAMEKLYEYMGIPEKEILKIPFAETEEYDGEEIILPINWLCATYRFSKKITPVYLGLALTTSVLSGEMKSFLIKYSPIGCRDEMTYNTLMKENIPAYLNGCLSLTFPTRDKRIVEGGSVYLIDAPKELLPFIPKRLLRNAKTVHNAILRDTDGFSIREYTVSLLQQLANNASLVITSRLHIASPCVALGIPTVLTCVFKKSTYSFLDKHIPIYTPEMFSQINWDPKPINIDSLKKNILDYCSMHIKNRYEEIVYQRMITDYYLNRDYTNDISFKFPWQETADDLIKRFEDFKDFTYSFWGINETIYQMQEFLTKQFPDAKMKNVYDKRKTGTIFDVEIKGASFIKDDDSDILFLLMANGVSDAKAELRSIGRRENEYYCVYGRMQATDRDDLWIDEKSIKLY